MTERASAPGRESGATAALWLAALQRTAVRGSHAMKNALNGVAVNLEVVRSRVQRAEATTEIYTEYDTLSLHDALPISCTAPRPAAARRRWRPRPTTPI